MTEDALPTSRPLPDLIGGRYRIVSRLGVGGMGIVYKAIDTQLNRAVAVKALEDRRLLFPGSAGRLKAEALAAASLDHPYICKVYELLEGPSETFIVMEFVEGETLSSMLKRGVLPLLQTLQIGREVAEGLATAHQRGLVHRDVKPSNVMVTTTGHVKLLDFGIAGADVETLPAEQTRTVSPLQTVHAGTPQYMAPEQAAGQPVTTRADLFSLGVLLYECVTGSLPFSGTTTFDYVRHVMQSAPRRLDRLAPDTPADLVDLIDKCLEKTPADRPDSAATVVTALRRLEDALASPHASVKTAREAQAGRRWLVMAAAAMGVAAVAIGWWFLGSPAPVTEPTFRSRPFVTSAAQESRSQISPDGQWVSFISTSGGASQIMMQRVDGGEARPLTLGQGTPISQVWSPDGKQLACVLDANGEWLLQIYPAFFGGAPQQTVSLAVGRPPGAPRFQSVRLLRWIDRTVYLNIAAPEPSLWRLDLAAPAGGVVNLSAGWTLAGPLRSVDVRPDGGAVAMTLRASGQDDVWIANLDGTGTRALTQDAFFERGLLWNGRGDRIIFQSNRGGQADLWQIDPRTKAETQLTNGETENTADSTSADGSLISFARLSQDAKLWLFGPVDPAGRQLTQDALSDYSPVISGDGRTVAFQRSQPSPSQGSTLIDATLLVAPLRRTAITTDVRPIADGYAASLSYDGAWAAYLQRSGVPQRALLFARDLASGTTLMLSRSATIPISSTVPAGWAGTTTAWRRTEAGNDVFFVDQPDVMALRRYHTGDAAPGPPLATANGTAEFLRDPVVSPDGGRLAYAVASRAAFVIHVIDLATGVDRQLAKRDPGITGTFLRGWLDDGLVVVERTKLNDDATSDVTVSLVNAATGVVTKIGTIPGAFVATTRLHAARRVLYVTRIENGVHNLYEFPLSGGPLKALTRNVLPGVTFSGFYPVGPDGLIGVRDERREDIWMMQESGIKRPGNSAGR